MIGFFHILQFALMFAVSVALALVAGRRREWRGGLAAMAFVFLGVAINEFDFLFDRMPSPWFDEPEVVPIITSLVCASLCVALWRGSTRTALFEVWRNRRFFLLVWGLLFVSLFANGIRSKHLWAVLAPEMTDSWWVRKFAMEMTKLFGHFLLLNWAALFFMDEWHRLVHRPSPHEHLLHENELVEIGQGARRVCYRIGETGYCVKFLRDPNDKTWGRKIGLRFRLMLLTGRFDRELNLNCQEAEAMVRARLCAGADVAAAFPEVIEIVFDEKRGYGILMNLLTNADGSRMIRADNEMARRKDPAFAAMVYPKLESLLNDLIEISAPFFEPANIQAQIQADGSVKLRLIDFEPIGKQFIPVTEWLPFVRRNDLRRRTDEFLKELREKYLKT